LLKYFYLLEIQKRSEKCGLASRWRYFMPPVWILVWSHSDSWTSAGRENLHKRPCAPMGSSIGRG